MALFDENVAVTPEPGPHEPGPHEPGRRGLRRQEPGRRGPRTFVVGLWSMAVAVIVLLVLAFLPTGFVIEQPGPVYDTLGSAPDASGTQVPLISVPDAKTYPTGGALFMLTVQVVGNREHRPSWMQLAAAWLDPSRAVMPIDAVFPEGQSMEERDQASTAMMVDSQKEATAAALTHLGYDVAPKVTVHSVVDGAAATGILQAGDVIVDADGTAITDVATLQRVIAEGGGAPVTMTVLRNGTRTHVSVTPKKMTTGGQEAWVIGVILTTDFTFPIKVDIQLNNVGGPSAGLMFALGIIDTLTPGELNGGREVAGTGTIDAQGNVGPIGGIRQKMFGAEDAGADYFLAPESNCGEVVGHIPSGIRVFSVKSLDGALTALDAIRTGQGLDKLRTCRAS